MENNTHSHDRRRSRFWLLSLLSICLPGFARAQDTTAVFTTTSEAVTAGTRASVWLNVLNHSAREVSWRFPPKIDCRFLSSPSVSDRSLELRHPTEAGQAAIGPGAFVRREYLLEVPVSLTGQVMVEFLGFGAKRIVLDVQAPAAVRGGAEEKQKSAFARFFQEVEPTKPGQPFDPGRFFQEHVSGHEPLYFIAGTEAPNAKFQISLKYQLLNSNGSLASNTPALKGLHIAYTQTSMWDWEAPSAPFLDSSYRPELLYSWERVEGGTATEWFRLDLQGGLQHESNGKGGDDSRNLNTAYMRPRLVFGKDEGLQLSLQPRAWVYVGGLEGNPNLPDYRGYADLRAVAGWKRGVQLSALGRIGDDGHHEGLQLDLTYPLMQLFKNNGASLYLHAQYFTGYGESLIRYDERSSSFRVGFSLYR